jgi:hypothetical protein
VSADVAVVAGAMAQQPNRAGHAWVFVNWMLSMRRLGYRVLFVDRIDASLGDVGAGVGWVADVMASQGLADSWTVLVGPEPADATAAGVRCAQVAALADDALLINVMGYLDDTDLLGRFAHRIFLDVDPGFGQVWQANGLADVFSGHDTYATVGLNLGAVDCRVPDLGISWVHTLPAVDLESWSAPAPPGTRFTTVASWRGPFAPVEFDGEVFGLRAHEARRFCDLPASTGMPLEIALAIDQSDVDDRTKLIDGGWSLRDPLTVAGDLGSYRSYIQGSLAEFSTAKQAYVAMRTGWFSDRSACYLAAGRPVIVPDTGFGVLPSSGDAVLTYRTRQEATEALAAVAADPRRHAAAALAFAEEHLDGRVVAAALLDAAQTGSAVLVPPG